MKLLVAAALFASLAAAPVLAKGCLEGAAVGGVAGHYVGRGHAVAGVAVGCAVGHHRAAKQARERRANAGQTSARR